MAIDRKKHPNKEQKGRNTRKVEFEREREGEKWRERKKKVYINRRKKKCWKRKKCREVKFMISANSTYQDGQGRGGGDED